MNINTAIYLSLQHNFKKTAMEVDWSRNILGFIFKSQWDFICQQISNECFSGDSSRFKLFQDSLLSLVGKRLSQITVQVHNIFTQTEDGLIRVKCHFL